jgi:hypothetical protein
MRYLMIPIDAKVYNATNFKLVLHITNFTFALVEGEELHLSCAFNSCWRSLECSTHFSTCKTLLNQLTW